MRKAGAGWVGRGDRKEVTDRKDVTLTIRLKFKTKVGERQDSSTYLVSLFPGTTHEPAPATPLTNAPDPAAPAKNQQISAILPKKRRERHIEAIQLRREL